MSQYFGFDDNICLIKTSSERVFSAASSVCLLLLLYFWVSVVLSQESQPLSCFDVDRVCKAYLHYVLPPNTDLQYVQDLLNVQESDISVEAMSPPPTSGSMGTGGQQAQQSLFVRVKCSCSSSMRKYFANAIYNLTSSNSTYTSYESVNEKYEGLAWGANYAGNTSNGTSTTNVAGPISIPLLCGCPSTDWNYLLSYVVEKDDTLTLLAERFNSNVSVIKEANNITNNYIYTGVVYYIPINFVSRPPDHVGSLQGGSPDTKQEEKQHRLSVLAEVGISFLCFAILAFLATTAYLYVAPKRVQRGSSGTCLFSSCAVCVWGSSSSCTRLADSYGAMRELRKDVSVSQGNLKKVLPVDMMLEKPILLSWNEVATATENFKQENLIGQGAYGSVFLGRLRNKDVAIKSMKANKTDEFLAELKVLCRVHHTNLVELIGYSMSEDDLFLVYEYVENNALSDRLHDPVSKGFLPLTWSQRVQIALDSAQGLEYIHCHTKEHYVHRDVKTSNILLDSCLRAKVADFGLAKLVLQTGETAVTRVVGTFGYLAPEYLRDSQATTKSDVYSFGVVLFELITGLEAVSRSRSNSTATSIVSMVLPALHKCSPSDRSALGAIVDRNLSGLYPMDALYEMAKLGKQCVENDPDSRPNMADVVFALSKILSSSMRWEAVNAAEKDRTDCLQKSGSSNQRVIYV